MKTIEIEKTDECHICKITPEKFYKELRHHLELKYMDLEKAFPFTTEGISQYSWDDSTPTTLYRADQRVRYQGKEGTPPKDIRMGLIQLKFIIIVCPICNGWFDEIVHVYADEFGKIFPKGFVKLN